MVEKKETIKAKEASTLWEQEVESIPVKKFTRSTAITEKLLVFGETGSGKTKFYIDTLSNRRDAGVKPKDMLAIIILPDRPTGITKLYNLIPTEYAEEDRIRIFPVNNYEDTIKATASSHKLLLDHYKQTGKHGYAIFELMENYWSFTQDYFCRKAYGKTLGEYFAQMQASLGSDKANAAAYEAFAGPFGGPWPIIKFFHNFNWIDKIKRFPYNTIFTSEIKEETNKDSIFFELGYRPAGEKHNQHRMDTIIYTSHVGNKFFIRPYKLTGYTKLYNKIEVTDKNDYTEHNIALKILQDRGYRVSPIEEIEQALNIKPKKEVNKKVDVKEKEEAKEDTDDWDL